MHTIYLLIFLFLSACTMVEVKPGEPKAIINTKSYGFLSNYEDLYFVYDDKINKSFYLQKAVIKPGQHSLKVHIAYRYDRGKSGDTLYYIGGETTPCFIHFNAVADSTYTVRFEKNKLNAIWLDETNPNGEIVKVSNCEFTEEDKGAVTVSKYFSPDEILAEYELIYEDDQVKSNGFYLIKYKKKLYLYEKMKDGLGRLFALKSKKDEIYYFKSYCFNFPHDSDFQLKNFYIPFNLTDGEFTIFDRDQLKNLSCSAKYGMTPKKLILKRKK